MFKKKEKSKIDRPMLRKLTKEQMLDIMLEQSREIEKLTAENEVLKQKIHDRKINIEESGSIAEASLRVTQIFAEAQKAADLYLENIRRIQAKDPDVSEEDRAKPAADPEHTGEDTVFEDIVIEEGVPEGGDKP